MGQRKNMWQVTRNFLSIQDFFDTDSVPDAVDFLHYDGRTFTRVSQKGAYAIIEDKKRKHLAHRCR